jgi:tetratricopeptide (TPR) repeat protein
VGIFSLLFICTTLSSQNQKIDSLLLLLKKIELKKQSFSNDTIRLGLYVNIGWEFDTKDNLIYAHLAEHLADSLLSETKNLNEKIYISKQKEIIFWNIENYYNIKKDTLNEMKFKLKRLDIVQEIKDTENIVSTFYDVANTYGQRGDLLKKLGYFDQGRIFSENLKYKRGIAFFIDAIGNLYQSNGDTLQAVENFQKALSIYSELNDSLWINNMMSELAGYYLGKDTAKSFGYSRKLLAIYQKRRDTIGTINYYSAVGDYYENKKDFVNALVYFNKCLPLEKLTQDPRFLDPTITKGTTLSHIAYIYYLTNDYSHGDEYQLKALSIFQEINDVDAMEYSYYKLASSQFHQNNFTKAKFYNDKALELIEKYNWINNVRNTEYQASQIDSILGNYKEAYFHFQKYILLANKFNREDIRKSAAKQKFQSDLATQKKVDKMSLDKIDAVAKADAHKQKIVLLFVVSGLLLVVLFAGFVFRSLNITRKQKALIEKQKHLVEEKQKEILDSIRYAKRIQNSLLPTEKYIDKNLKRLTDNNT